MHVYTIRRPNDNFGHRKAVVLLYTKYTYILITVRERFHYSIRILYVFNSFK